MMWEILEGELWQGNLASAIETGFHVKVCCTLLGELPDLVPARFHILCPFADEPHLPDEIGDFVELAKFLAAEISAGKKVLIHCNQGWNRSGLLCGMVLLELGYKNVVQMVKEAHPEALQNQTFCAYLESRS